MRKRKLTQKICRELLDYDEMTGTFFWKYRQRHWFKSDRSFSVFNARFPGRVAFSSCDSDGYPQTKLLGRLYRAHRVVWLWVHGTKPIVVEHINHDRADFRLANLKAGTSLTNARDKALSANNTSGQTGVFRAGSSWIVQIQDEYLGSFADYDEACAERLAEQIERGFAPRHGAVPHGDAHV